MPELPMQVQAQLEEAERIQQQLSTPPAEPQPPAEPEPAPEPQPADPPEPPPQPAPAAPVEPHQDAAYWQQRFRTLEGIHRSTADQLKAQGEHMRLITAQLEAMRTQAPQPTATPEQPLVTSQDDEKFGSDLVDLARRVTRQEFRPVEARLKAIEELIRRVTPQVDRVARVEQEVAQSREERFWTDLTTAVPDWEQVNTDQRWLQWLQEYDPVAGTTRQKSLEAGQAVFDARRVSALFKLFKSSVAPAQQVPSTKAKSQAELARQVAPSRTSTVTVPPQGEKRYTGSDYTFWFDPRRTADRQAQEVATMKAELDRAHAEGRIDWTA